MPMSRVSSFLRRALVVDAAISGSTGVLMMAGAAPLQEMLGIPGVLLRYAGVSLLPFAAALGYLSRRDDLPPAAVRAVIAANAAWVAASVGLLLSGRVEPTPLGYAFVLAQALAVAVFAEMQYVGLRRSAAAA